jgi:hypothetical protein
MKTLARTLIIGNLLAASVSGVRADVAADSIAALKSNPSTISLDQAESGHSLYKSGNACLWTGAALVPLGLLALVPVLHDGAFGITAADPGIGGAILAAGGGFITLGIPLVGYGAEREAQAAKALHPGFEPHPSALRAYRQSWQLIGAGGALVLVAMPLGIVGALDYENDNALDYTALTLLIGGATVGGMGVLEQWWSGYCFVRSHRKSHDALHPPVSLSLQPVLRLAARGSDGAGLKLVANF